MIIVQFTGGLGNQLSQFGLYTEYRARGLKAYADLSWYGNAQPKDGKADARKLELPHLGINLEMCPEKYAYYGNEDKLHRYLRRIMVGPTYLEKDYKFTPELLEVKKGYVMGGCFLGEQYMPYSERVVRDSINFRGTDEEYIQQMEKKITSCNSVSIHIRLGDYLNLSELYGNICTPEYYKNSIEVIKNRVENPVFFVFSNDVHAAIEMLGLEGAVAVEGNTGDKSYLDMYLMSKCKHNIIANSTFSWWGAWLNENKEKIVCCPTTLLNGFDNGSVYCKEWLRIEPK
jgi:hypothetical protein